MTRITWLTALLLACGSGTTEPAPNHEAAPAAAAAPKAAVQAAPKGSRSDVTIEELAKLRESGVTVVDVRTDEEYASGHVPGALHVSLDTLSADNPTIAGLPKDAPVYFICQSGGRSSRAADAMAAAGMTTVNVKGGTGAWIAAGYAVE